MTNISGTPPTSPSIQERLHKQADYCDEAPTRPYSLRSLAPLLREAADHIDKLSERIAELEADRDAS